MLFMRAFMKFPLGSIWEVFTTNFAIVIMELYMSGISSSGLQSIFRELKYFSTMFTDLCFHGFHKFFMAFESNLKKKIIINWYIIILSRQIRLPVHSAYKGYKKSKIDFFKNGLKLIPDF